MQIDLGILTETKITNDRYTRDCCEYTVLDSHAKSKFQKEASLSFIKITTIHGGLKVKGSMTLMLCHAFLSLVNDNGM
jgi:hypothetical protein